MLASMHTSPPIFLPCIAFVIKNMKDVYSTLQLKRKSICGAMHAVKRQGEGAFLESLYLFCCFVVLLFWNVISAKK
jgi:hypothetical protein